MGQHAHAIGSCPGRERHAGIVRKEKETAEGKSIYGIVSDRQAGRVHTRVYRTLKGYRLHVGCALFSLFDQYHTNHT